MSLDEARTEPVDTLPADAQPLTADGGLVAPTSLAPGPDPGRLVAGGLLSPRALAAVAGLAPRLFHLGRRHPRPLRRMRPLALSVAAQDPEDADHPRRRGDVRFRPGRRGPGCGPGFHEND